jgi:Fur family zinc uptake transcriptional regulator
LVCRTNTIARAERAFAERGMRMTDLRAMVLAEIAGSHHALGAYDIIGNLAEKGTRLAPISVYRAIDALIEAGVVHRLESRNAYFACHASHVRGHQHLILACQACGTIAEVEADDILAAIDAAAARVRFAARSRIVEVAGVCANCSEGAAGV